MSHSLVFELVGVAGISIGALAYLPQIVHLAHEHCSAGISSRAWAMWLMSAVLVGAFALYRRDPVFIALQATSLSSAAVIVGSVWGFFFSWKRSSKLPTVLREQPTTAAISSWLISST